MKICYGILTLSKRTRHSQVSQLGQALHGGGGSDFNFGFFQFFREV